MKMRRRASGGQAAIEFVLLTPVLLLLAMGTLDVSNYYSDRIQLQTAVRGATRFATANPYSWSNAASAAPNTIEGVLQTEASPLSVLNNDSHISIKYYDISTGSEVQCGHYSASTGLYTNDNSYTQAKCIVVNNLVKVTVVYGWTPSTPLVNSVLNFNSNITFTYTMAIG